MSGAPERPQRPRQALFAVAAGLVGGVLLLPLLFAIGLGRVMADVWVSVMAAVIELARALFGAG